MSGFRVRDRRPWQERVLDGFDIDPENECWAWRRARNGDGYGIVHLNGRALRAHRLAYELLVGPIPEGLVLDHLCRNRACVNPDHLEPVTQRVNVVVRSVFSASAKNAAKATCPRGHPYDGVWPHSGGRYCKTCHQAKVRRQGAARRG